MRYTEKQYTDIIIKQVKDANSLIDDIRKLELENEQLKKQLTLTDVVFSEAELKAKLEEQLEETRQWLIGEDFEGLAERL